MAVKIYSDGSCIGNPGPGGWAALIVHGKKTFRIQDGVVTTTNNRMELTAAIWGIKTAIVKFPDEHEFQLYSDSAWVVNTMTKNWKRKKNLDLWEELMPLLIDRKITWHWVKAHSGHPENEDCDTRAFAEAQKQVKIANKMPEDPKFFVQKDEPPTLL